VGGAGYRPRKDVAAAERAVNALVRMNLIQGQFDALVSFAYNLGVGTLERSTLLRLVEAGEFAAAAN
jgi:lysozyme